ncbi:two-component sensor histidine kinase BarA, partial [Escherichia coli]|nr:two-component sensor histidine kinase BarA [Escherichia coli]
LVAKHAQQRDVELGYLFDPAVPARVNGDSLRLRQVLINLVSNAVKFTEHGEVSISVSLAAGPQFGLQFEVRDSGIGMSAHEQASLFESFAQAD